MPSPLKNETALVIDLDGTLYRSDLLWECLSVLMRNRPWLVVSAFLTLLRGRANLKRFLWENAPCDVTKLPYIRETVDLVHRQQESKAKVIIATAAWHEAARAIANHLKIEGTILATEGETNLKSQNKWNRLKRELAGDPYRFAGDSHADLPCMQEAQENYLVAPSASLLKKAPPNSQTLTGKTKATRSLTKLLRVHHWTKNLLIFLPAISSYGLYEAAKIPHLIIGFIGFCCVSSLGYLINDFLDLEADRSHPIKKNRPLASGKASPTLAFLACIVLAIIGISAYSMTPQPIANILPAYLALTLTYSFYFKTKVVIDIAILSTFYLIRILFGSELLEAEYSSWFILFFFFFFLNLALTKRFSDLINYDTDHSQSRRGYRAEDAQLVKTLGIACLFSATIVLSLYSENSDSMRVYSNPTWILALCPLYLFHGIILWFETDKGRVGHDPVNYILKQPFSYVIGAIAALIVFLAR